MDQFNKVLAAFLILVVAVGLSLFIFSRLGILGRIFPSSKLAISPTPSTVTPTSTIVLTPSPNPSEKKSGILGWLSGIGKPKPEVPTPTTTQKSTPISSSKSACPDCIGETLNPNDKQDITTSSEQLPPTQIPNTPNTNITIIPYGATSSQTYPASGIETLFVPSVFTISLLGFYLKRKARV